MRLLSAFALLPPLLLLSLCVTLPRHTGAQQKRRHRVAIIGGGIPGCAAGWRLKRTLGDAVEIRVIEADSRLGGRIHSFQIPGADRTIVELGVNRIQREVGNPLFDFAKI